MGQRRDNQGRFARRLFSPAAPTASTPAPVRPKPQSQKTPAGKLKYDPRVDAARLEKALDPSVGWFARRALRKELEQQFGKIDWKITSVPDDAAEVRKEQSDAAALPNDRQPGASIETLRAFAGQTGNLWVRIADTGSEQFRKVAEGARVEVRPAEDPEADRAFTTGEHVLTFYGSITERRFADDILFYPTGRS